MPYTGESAFCRFHPASKKMEKSGQNGAVLQTSRQCATPIDGCTWNPKCDEHKPAKSEDKRMLLKTYRFEDVEAAIARTNAISLPDLKNGTDNRNYSAQGSSPYLPGTGHVYAHVATYTQRLPSTDTGMSRIKTNQGGKSLWQNRRMAIYACMELLNRDPKVREWLGKFDSGRRTEPIDVIKRPLVGDYYGYMAGETELKKATTAAINIFGVAGALCIYSTYPCDMAGYDDPELDLASLFES